MGKSKSTLTLSTAQRKELLSVLKGRFEKNMHRHQGIEWEDVQAKLNEDKESEAKLWSLYEMERTGGEPDVVSTTDVNDKIKTYFFYDCSPESPKGRRSLCYDRHALEARKEHKPQSSALDLADSIGIELLTVEQYKALQQFESFDTKTSSWVKTPAEIRALGGALFCDRRYNTVFVYHNGADSYYAARGFRGVLTL